jgi:hypothetical protein
LVSPKIALGAYVVPSLATSMIPELPDWTPLMYRYTCVGHVTDWPFTVAVAPFTV